MERGLPLWNNEILQLTWKANLGFVYTLDGFKQVRTFNFPNAEGWGLTTVEDELAMTDGSEYLYFMDPDELVETVRVAVYDDKGPVREINELEYHRWGSLC